MNIQIFDLPLLVAFWLCFTRWLTVIFQLPLFDDVAVPVIVKVLASLVITYAFFPHTSAWVLQDIQHVGIQHLWALTIGHALIGLVIGFLVKSIMSVFTSTGYLLTQQVGFGAVSYFDPSQGQQVGPFERLIGLTIVVMIISSGALMPMFKGVFNSFHTIRIMELGKLAHSPEFFFEMFKSLFVTSILLASPLVFTNLLLNLIMGIIARTVPQMNVLMVSFVVSIGMGLLVFIVTSNEFFQVAYKVYVDKLGEWFQFIS